MVKKQFQIFFVLSFLFINGSLFSQDPLVELKRGQREYNRGNYQNALKIIEIKIADGPSIWRVDLHFLAAKSCYKADRRNYPNSLNHLNAVISLEPSNIEALFLKAQILQFEEGLNPEAYNTFKKVTELSGNNDILFKSVSLYSMGQKQKALEYLRWMQANVKKKKLATMNYAFSIYYSEEGMANQSLEHFRAAIDGGYEDLDWIMLEFNGLKNNETFIAMLDSYGLSDSFYQSITEEIVRHTVESKMNKWQLRGKYEKTSDYLERINEQNRAKQIEYYTRQVIDSLGTSKISWSELYSEYDPDNEAFKITFSNYNPVYVSVPIDDAPYFDEYFKSLRFNNIQFNYLGRDEFDLVHMEITTPGNHKTYVYDSDIVITYNSNNFNFNFDEVEIPLNYTTKTPDKKNVTETSRTIDAGKSDVDTNIPKTNLNNSNTYALIIGNEDYTKYQTSLSSESNVDYAIRDAEIFAEYAEKTLGIPNENITILKDAISSQMQREIEKISKIAMYHNGEANIIFYYAGHGFPDETTKESYLMPVDVSGTDVKYGIKLSYLYQQLTQYPSQKVLVILDACFSGGGRNQGLLAARGVKIKPKENLINGNLVVFSSSSGEQSSLPYQNKQHGMFTYFLLKKLKESKGEITLEELSDYVTKEVQINALKINSKEQNPNILVSPDVGNLWMDWKLN